MGRCKSSLWAGGLLLLHGGLALPLVDSALQLRPDSSEFLLGANALALGQGYRDLAQLHQPKLLQRPVGMSLMLSPIARRRGYDVVAGKWVVLGLGLLGGWCLWHFVSRISSPAGGLCVLALWGVNPITLTINTELMSEGPMLSCVLAMLACMAGPITSLRLVAIIGLTLLAELLRSQAMVLWPALLLWGLAAGDRWRKILAVGVGIAITVVLKIGFVECRGPLQFYWNYLTGVSATAGEGIGGLLPAVLGSLEVQGAALCGLIFPFLWPDLAQQEIGVFPWTPPIVSQFGGLIVLLLFLGALRNPRWAESASRDAARWFLIGYVGLSFLLLLIWPHRMSRLAYPILPVIAAVSLPWLFERLRRFGPRFAVSMAVVLGFVHVAAVIPLFPRTEARVPGWKEWEQTGHWLREHTPPYTRVVTNREHLFFTSARWQSRPDFSLGGFNACLAATGATFVRVTAWPDEPILTANPTYRFRPAPIDVGPYRLLEVLPNFAGTCQLDRVPATSAALQGDGRQGITPLQWRVHELRQAAKFAEAAKLLFKHWHCRSARGPGKIDAWLELASLALDQEQPDVAISLFKQARGGYIGGADYEPRIQAGIEHAELLLASKAQSLSPAIRAELCDRLADNELAMAQWNRALQMLDRALQFDPDWFPSRLRRILVLRRLGRTEAAAGEIDGVLNQLALRLLTAAERQQNPFWSNAWRQGVILHAPKLLQGGKIGKFRLGDQDVALDPKDPNHWLHTVALLRLDGLHGVALGLLQKGAERLPMHPEIWLALGEERERFGQYPQALADYQRASTQGAAARAAVAIQRVEKVLASSPVWQEQRRENHQTVYK